MTLLPHADPGLHMRKVCGTNVVIFPHIAALRAVCVVPSKLFVKNTIVMVVSIMVVIRSSSSVP